MDQIIIDVREPHEYMQSHVEGALNIPLSQLSHTHEKLVSIPKDSFVILYCRSGGRSSAALSALKSMGYTNLINGINEERVNSNYL